MRLLRVIVLLLPGVAVAQSDDDELFAIDRVETMAEALQTSHMLISRVAENFACDAPYEVFEASSSDETMFTTRIYADEPGCHDMIRGLNTWGRLYGIEFKVSPRRSAPRAAPPAKHDLIEQDLIHKVDPALPPESQ